MSDQTEPQPASESSEQTAVETAEMLPISEQPEVAPVVEPAAAAPVMEPPFTGNTVQQPRPRSIKRRLEERQTPERQPLSGSRPSRVRSQPLPGSAAPRRPREPVVLDWEPEPQTGPWRAKPLVVGLALLAWIAALALLLSEPGRLVGAAPRVLVPGSWALAAALTFIPVQVRLGLPGVGWQAMLGFGLLGYLLAFVPAPTGWLLDLPDLPVYLLLFFAVFYAVTATIVPLSYLIGQRFYKLRIHRLDVGRARRQGYEVGLLIVVTLGMAGLRVLTPMTFGLLVLVVVLTEALLLSQVQPEG